jgi:hypothetical protein
MYFNLKTDLKTVANVVSVEPGVINSRTAQSRRHLLMIKTSADVPLMQQLMQESTHAVLCGQPVSSPNPVTSGINKDCVSIELRKGLAAT